MTTYRYTRPCLLCEKRVVHRMSATEPDLCATHEAQLWRARKILAGAAEAQALVDAVSAARKAQGTGQPP